MSSVGPPPPHPPPPPAPPSGTTKKDDHRPWWKKKRYLIPAGLVVLVAAFGQDPDDETAQPLPELASTTTTSTPASTAEPASPTTVEAQPTVDPSVPTDPTVPASPLEFAVSAAQVSIAIQALESATVLDDLGAPAPYRRAEYSDGWGDADGDCISDRHEILLERSEVPAEIVDCNVTTGQWTDPYDGKIYTNARLVTIDHFVPLAAAHRAGAWAWDLESKRAFAADIGHQQSHVPAGQRTNEDKADQEPHEWRPARAAWCGYALNWISVKTRWELAYSTAEAAALEEMLRTCEPDDTITTPATTAPPASPTTSTTTTSTTTSLPPATGPAAIQITRCDARGETVELVNLGGEIAALTGWILHDERRNHETNLNRVVLDPGDRIIMLSGEDTLETPGTLRWTGRNVWNNDGDEAFLLDQDGNLVSRQVCSG